MATVSSLDKDLRNMRLSKYTPKAANEVRGWIEDVLGEQLQSGDLLEALKDGVALCRLINLAVSPGVKFKQSPMPFVQMENISHFLRACQLPPLSLAPHDVFLTVDLYEAKDPAQVLQCIGAFSRRANAVNPSRFPRTLGAKSKAGAMSPQETGGSQDYGYASNTMNRSRGTSNVSESTNFRSSYSGRTSPDKPKSPSGPATSSWSRKNDEGITAPAWNIHQYGYMGGASQGNQGISFGSRRQLTSPAPAIPSLAEKEKKRRGEEEQQRQQAQEAEYRRRQEREAEDERAREAEERARQEEEQRWAEETKRQAEKERRDAEEEERRWAEVTRRRQERERRDAEDERRRVQEDEEKRAEQQRRVQAERAEEERLQRERQRRRGDSDARLRGQFLSQYQSEQSQTQSSPSNGYSTDSERIRELERQLAEAKERERQFEEERVAHSSKSQARSRSRSRPRPRSNSKPKPNFNNDDDANERDFLRQQWQNNDNDSHSYDDTENNPPLPARPLPEPRSYSNTNVNPPLPSRPLPDPSTYANRPPPTSNRTDRFLSSNAPPTAPKPKSYTPAESAHSTTAEVDAENARRNASTQRTRAGGWASKSLLEREMERERERQREWEESQAQTKEAVQRGVKTAGSAPGEGGWSTAQYGYMGGDSQNRGGPGLGIGGARRQIIGPRPPP